MARLLRTSLAFLTALLVMVLGEMQMFDGNVQGDETMADYGNGDRPLVEEYPRAMQSVPRYKHVAFTGYRRHRSRDYEYDGSEPDFTYRLDNRDNDEHKKGGKKSPFAAPPQSSRYYAKATHMPATESKRAHRRGQMEVVETFEPRQHRQNPNLAANKFNKVVTSTEQVQNGPIIQRIHPFGKFASERDIPTSLVPNSLRHQHISQHPVSYQHEGDDKVMNIYIFAMFAGIIAATVVAVAAFAFGWYTMQRKMKAAADAEYPAYGVTGPNPQGSPSGDRKLAHSAQLYHYQHQKQQIIAMENNRGGVAERNGSVSDAESEDENEEGDYTVYECPGFATTGELEVKNPLFQDEPTPATPATNKDSAKDSK